MKFLKKIICGGLLLAGMMMAAIADDHSGGVSFGDTRIVFLSTDKAQSITLKNHGQHAYLVKSFEGVAPQEQQDATFMVTPSLFRLEANQENKLQILCQNIEKLPIDREAMFYLSVITVPSLQKVETPDGEPMPARSFVDMQHIIKLLYRPKGLSMTPAQAEKALIFTQHGKQVRVRNPTSYYQTFAKLALDGTPTIVSDSMRMIPPFGQVSYSVNGAVHKAEWSIINDSGGSSQAHHAIVRRGVGI